MITFSVDPASRIRTATYSGVITDADLLASYQGLLAESDYDPALNDLADLRQVTRLEVSSDALRELMKLYIPIDELAVPTLLAIVAASDLTYGMSRMYELIRGDGGSEQIMVFRSYEEAVVWLNSTKPVARRPGN